MERLALTSRPYDRDLSRFDAPPPGRGRSASAAAFLSFLWPGLGQGYAGRRRAAIGFALPIVLLALGAVVLVVASLGLLATLIIQTASAFALIAILLLAAAVAALVVLTSGGSGDRVDLNDVVKDNIPEQIDELKQVVEDNRE